jgi:hypothetical protein
VDRLEGGHVVGRHVNMDPWGTDLKSTYLIC